MSLFHPATFPLLLSRVDRVGEEFSKNLSPRLILLLNHEEEGEKDEDAQRSGHKYRVKRSQSYRRTERIARLLAQGWHSGLNCNLPCLPHIATCFKVPQRDIAP